MKYILTLFLITLISSSDIINKANEIKEFSEYEDAELQFNLEIIPYIGAVYSSGKALFASAKAFIIGTKIFKLVKYGNEEISKFCKEGKDFISKGRDLLQKAKIFQLGRKTFYDGINIYNRYIGITRNPKLYKRIIATCDKVKLQKIYQIYKKMRDTYNKAKDIYDKIKNYYKQYLDIYNRYLKKDKTPEEQRQEYLELEKNSIKKYQAQQQRLKLIEEKLRQIQIKRQEILIQQKLESFQHYIQLRNNNTMTLDSKQIEINNYLNYMLNNGFITPTQKQEMSYI